MSDPAGLSVQRSTSGARSFDAEYGAADAALNVHIAGISLRAPARRNAIIVVVVALMVVGVVMVASASASLDRSLWAQLTWRAPFGRQVILFGIGLLVMTAAARLAVPVLEGPALRRRLVQLAFLLALGGLVAALVPGIATPLRGSQRWLSVATGGHTINIQPSEFAKLALVAFLAWLLADRQVDPRSFWRSFVPGAAAIGLFVGLIGSADFGTAALFTLVGGLMFLVAGCRIRDLIFSGAIGLAGLTLLLWIEPYRRERITAFLAPGEDPLGAGYQPMQSLLTIASGGWSGLGLGAGVQKYGYLPESHTDFIFAVICEETGAVGALLVVALFCVFVWLGIRAVWAARSGFERLLAFGIVSTIGWQAVMNIAVVTVVAPTTGISLPFVSAGGSGLLTSCLGAGILAAVAFRGASADPIPQITDEAIRYGPSPEEASAW